MLRQRLKKQRPLKQKPPLLLSSISQQKFKLKLMIQLSQPKRSLQKSMILRCQRVQSCLTRLFKKFSGNNGSLKLPQLIVQWLSIVVMF